MQNKPMKNLRDQLIPNKIPIVLKGNLYLR